MKDIAFILPFKYKNTEYLKKTVESIKKYSKNSQIIIVDDNSGLKINTIPSLKGDQIEIIENKNNLGPAQSRNIGLQRANAKYICYLDSDDTLISDFQDKFETYILKKNEKNPVVFLSDSINESGAKIFNFANFLRNIFLFATSIFSPTLPKSLFYAVSTSRLILPIKIAKQYKFNEKLRQCEDWDLVIRMMESLDIQIITKKVINFRYYEDSQTKIQLKINKTNIYRKMLEKSGIEFNFFTAIFKLYIFYLEKKLK